MKPNTEMQPDVIAELGWVLSVDAAQRVSGKRKRPTALASPMDMSIDAELVQAARNALKWWTYLPSNAVKVSADHRWITLSGQVENDDQRRSVVDVIRRLGGVFGVSEKITVKPHIFDSM